MSLFDRPIEEWTLAELAAGAGSAGQLRDEAVARGEHESAEHYQAWALVFAEHRDARVKLQRDVEGGFAPASADISDLLRLEEFGEFPAWLADTEPPGKDDTQPS